MQPAPPARQGRAVFAANAVRWDRAAQRARPVPPDLPAGLPARRDPPDLVEQQARLGRQVQLVQPDPPAPAAQPERFIKESQLSVKMRFLVKPPRYGY